MPPPVQKHRFLASCERLFRLLVSGSGATEAHRQAAQRLREVLLKDIWVYPVCARWIVTDSLIAQAERQVVETQREA